MMPPDSRSDTSPLFARLRTESFNMRSIAVFHCDKSGRFSARRRKRNAFKIDDEPNVVVSRVDCVSTSRTLMNINEHDVKRHRVEDEEITSEETQRKVQS
jgi:hypothetical protein